jgi:hypothetical protein
MTWTHEAAAVLLAPQLYESVMISAGTTDPPAFVTLPTKVQAQWFDNAAAVINVLKGPTPTETKQPDPEATRKTFAVIWGGKL